MATIGALMASATSQQAPEVGEPADRRADGRENGRCVERSPPKCTLGSWLWARIMRHRTKPNAPKLQEMREFDRHGVTETARLGDGMRESVAWIGRALGRISWTVVDEALLGFASFTTNLLLARWLTPAEYGGYMAGSAVYWMIASPHGALLTEPMMVFGPAHFRNRLALYFPILVASSWCISSLIAALLVSGGVALIFLGSKVSGLSMIGYGLAAPITMLLWLFRRTFYVQSAPWLAAATSTIYLVGLLAIIFTLYRSGTLSAFTAPLAAAGASGLAVAGINPWRGLRLRSPWHGQFAREVAVAHWRYGRWALLTGILIWAPGSIYFVLLPLFTDLEANAGLSALRTLVLPALHLYTASALLLIPALARARQKRGAASPIWGLLAVLIAGAAIYALLIALFGRPLMAILFRGQYMQYARYAWLMGLIALPAAGIAALGSDLRARGRPDRVFWAYVIATAVTGTFGVGAVATCGLLGAILGLLAGYVTTMLVLLWWVARLDGGTRPPPVASNF